MPLAIPHVQQIIDETIRNWNHNHDDFIIYAGFLKVGDLISIPTGIAFGATGHIRAGMELPIKIQGSVIIINEEMNLESKLCAFLHEFSHARYRYEHPNDWDEIESEKEAINMPLAALDASGLSELAYREAQKILNMSAPGTVQECG